MKKLFIGIVFFITLRLGAQTVISDVLTLDGSYSVADIQATIKADRAALRNQPDDRTTRVQLGAAYLLLEQMDPTASGSFQKGIDQFLLVLSKQPDDPQTLVYLANPRVLAQMKPKLEEGTLHRLILLLERQEEAVTPLRLTALTALANVAGDTALAGEISKVLPAGAQNSLLAGISELQAQDWTNALTNFQSAAGDPDPGIAALAQLGEAESLYKAGDLNGADDTMSQIMFDTNLEDRVSAYALEKPSTFKWELGTALAKAGMVDQAFCYLSDETADTVIQEGLRYNDNGDKQKALDLLLAALQIPDKQNQDCLWAVGVLSFDLGKYRDAVWAFTQSEQMGRPLEKMGAIKLGVSYLTLGQYQQAYDRFDQTLAKNPNDDNLKKWRAAAAFGVGGWDLALATLQSDLPTMGPTENSLDLTYSLVSGVYGDLDRRAQAAGLDYARLQHLGALTELFSRFALSGGNDIRQAKWNTIWEAIDIYRRLPLKPRPPQRAVAQEEIAESQLNAGTLTQSTMQAAIAATEIAPWWPEARYNLGVLFRDSYCSAKMVYLSVYMDNRQTAAQEFIFYMNLAPEGDKAAQVKKQLKKWKVNYQ